jgi:phosphoribosylformylglycinamidine (FGAM) synthase PurS component
MLSVFPLGPDTAVAVVKAIGERGYRRIDRIEPVKCIALALNREDGISVPGEFS